MDLPNRSLKWRKVEIETNESYQKSGKTNDPISRKIKKPHFWAILGLNLPNFFKKIICSVAYRMVYGPLDSFRKSGKTNDPKLRKVKKTHFWAILGPNLPKKILFQKIICGTSNGQWSFRFIPKIRKN